MRLISILSAFLFITACTSMANIDYDRNVNFKSFTTFNIQTKPVSIDDDTRVNTSFMQERIINAISNELIKKGFKREEDKADLKVKYHIDVVREFETEEPAVSIGFGTSSHHSAIGMGFVFPVGETYSIDKLVLTIDLFSAKTNKLIWRGTLGYGLDPGSTPERYTRLANELIAEILKNFPPK